jgi:glycosyltransferase involved in cell wall biosynthesis
VHEYLIEQRSFNNAAAIHYTSEGEMKSVPIKIKAPSLIIPLGIDLKKYQNLPPYGMFKDRHNLQRKKIILHFGRINFTKGLDILVKAFAQIAFARNDICLVLAGPDNEGYARQIEKWLIEEGIKDKAIFTGMLQGIDKLAILKDADIFALPSYSESFGIAVVEAMACGLPVVISNRVNIWREIQNAGAGLVTSCDACELAEALQNLLNDENIRFRMGEAGKILVNTTYNWKTVVNDLLKAYEDILRHRTCHLDIR